ncbi:hypothetical protein CYMTET_16320 [Cymbomonas tetramitiformis]|uniref:S1 motif domain-containing protein n=1 Tax=Cymbomonas tetramitiformis TaxID=36881 RepID=A0AAE0GCG8_9CHLO|nr:hypothetical protein CYMTET_16320 [Cymbomonas tetramitiformis]
MDLSMKKVLDERRAGLLWQEIQAAAERSQPIMGRVLNAVNGGFAVGVGGYVAFLPTSRVVSTLNIQVGKLQPFNILSIREETANIVLSMPTRAVPKSLSFMQSKASKPSVGWAEFLKSVRRNDKSTLPKPPME